MVIVLALIFGFFTTIALLMLFTTVVHAWPLFALLALMWWWRQRTNTRQCEGPVE